MKMIHTQPPGREKANTGAVWKAKADLILLWHVGEKVAFIQYFAILKVFRKHILSAKKQLMQFRYITFYRASFPRKNCTHRYYYLFASFVVLALNVLK